MARLRPIRRGATGGAQSLKARTLEDPSQNRIWAAASGGPGHEAADCGQHAVRAATAGGYGDDACSGAPAPAVAHLDRCTRCWYHASAARDTMPKNTSFILGDHFDAFVAALVSAGRYQSATDVIRSGLRLLEERETRLKALRRALIAGEKSGTAGPLDLAKIKKQARRSAGRKPA